MAARSRRTKIAAEEKTRIVLSVLAGELTCAEAFVDAGTGQSLGVRVITDTAAAEKRSAEILIRRNSTSIQPGGTR